jgi:hypothetical protein
MPLAYTRPKTTITKPPDVTSTKPPGIRSLWILLAPTSTREPPTPNVQQTDPDFSFLLRCCPSPSLLRQLPSRATTHVRFAHSTVSRHRPGLFLPRVDSPDPTTPPHTSSDTNHSEHVRTTIPTTASGLLDASLRLPPPHHAAHVPRPRWSRWKLLLSAPCSSVHPAVPTNEPQGPGLRPLSTRIARCPAAVLARHVARSRLRQRVPYFTRIRDAARHPRRHARICKWFWFRLQLCAPQSGKPASPRLRRPSSQALPSREEASSVAVGTVCLHQGRLRREWLWIRMRLRVRQHV